MSELLKKKALDALLETMDRTYPHADPDYSKPFGEKGTEMDSNRTDQVTIPAKDFRTASPTPRSDRKNYYDEWKREVEAWVQTWSKAYGQPITLDDLRKLLPMEDMGWEQTMLERRPHARVFAERLVKKALKAQGIKPQKQSSEVQVDPKLAPPEGVEDATFFKESDPDMNPVEEEVAEHEFLKESITYDDLKSIPTGSPAEVEFSEECARSVDDYDTQDEPRQPFMGKYEIAKKDYGDEGAYVVYDQGKPVGRLQPGWFGVLPEYRGKGIGTELVRQYTQQYPDYKPHGFSPAGRRSFEKALTPQYEMVRASAKRPAYIVEKKADFVLQDISKIMSRHGYTYTGPFTDGTVRYSKGRDEYVMIYPKSETFAHFVDGLRDKGGELTELDSILTTLKPEQPVFAAEKTASKNVADPGEGNYDFKHEAHVRKEIKDWAQYAEEEDNTEKIKPYDPNGTYLCKDCDMREGTNECMRVEGPISFETGGCRLFHYDGGNPPETDPPMKGKFTQEEVKYGEHKGGFQCGNCEYGAKAAAADPEGRPSWCSFWGTHIIPTACCSEWELGEKEEKTAKAANFVDISALESKLAGAYLYHVTHTDHVAKIKEKGILPLQTTNWVQGEGGERYGTGEIYAFDHPNDAVRWAARMDWEFNKGMGTGKISIVVFKKGKGQWEVDSNDPISQMGSMGHWLKLDGKVSPDQIVKIIPVTQDLIRPVVQGEQIKLAAVAPEVKRLWREYERTYPTGTMDQEKVQQNLHRIGHFILTLKGELESLTANENMFDTDSKYRHALGRVKEAENLWDRGNYPLAVRVIRWAFELLIPEAKQADGPDTLNRKEQFEKLHAKWKAFTESIGWPGKVHVDDMGQMAKEIPVVINFADKLEALKPVEKTLFEGADVTFDNTTENLRKGKQRLEKVLKYIPEVTGEWAHRSEYNERDLAWWFDAGIGDIQIGFHNLAVEYMYMEKPKQGNTKTYGVGMPSNNKAWGTGTPIGGTENAVQQEADLLEKDDDQQQQPQPQQPMTASFDVTAADYMPMFQTLIEVKPDVKPEVQQEINWAKTHLKKADRITWYLRWVRLYIERRWAGGRNKKIKQMFDKDIASYSKKNPIKVEDIPSDLGGIKSKLEHWMSLTDKAVQDKVFAYETFAQLAREFAQIEADIAERQESERRIVKQGPRDRDEVFMQFPNGWQWVWLQRASCSAEAEAMGHCGNSPRSDTEDTILSLRQPVNKGGKTYWSPHLTFILDKGHVIGEMKGRNNNKPTSKYHPYIVALLKDQRIKGIKGGGYKPENNFKLEDLTDQQREEIKEANPQIFRVPETPEDMAEMMGLDEDAWHPDKQLFVVREWSSVRRMVQDLGNGEAEYAVDYAIEQAEGKLQADGDYHVSDEDLPDIDDIAGELAHNLSFEAMRNIGRRLEQEDDWLIREFAQQQHESMPLDYANSELFERLMNYVGNRAPNSPFWQTVKAAYREGKEIKYKQYRVSDLEYLIEQHVYEQADSPIYTEFRYGPDFSPRLDWLAKPCYEVITYKDAKRMLQDGDADRNLSDGQIKTLYLYEDDYDRSGYDEDYDESYTQLDRWYTQGFPQEENEDQMKFNFNSSLLKKAKKTIAPDPDILSVKEEKDYLALQRKLNLMDELTPEEMDRWNDYQRRTKRDRPFVNAPLLTDNRRVVDMYADFPDREYPISNRYLRKNLNRGIFGGKKKSFVPVKETPRMLPQRDDMRRHIDEEVQDQVMEGVMDGIQPNQPKPRQKPRREQIDPNATVSPETALMGDIKPNPDMVSLSAAVEGEVLPKRADFWNLYVYNPAGKLTGTYYVQSKQEGVQRVAEMFGFLNHNEENELYRVGRLNLYDGREPVAIVSLTKWPKPPVVEPIEPMEQLDVYAAKKEAGPLSKAVLPIALSLGMMPGLKGQDMPKPQPKEHTSIEVEPMPGDTIIDKSEGKPKVIQTPKVEPKTPGVIKPMSPKQLQEQKARGTMTASALPEDAQAEQFLEKVREAEAEAREAFNQDQSMLQEAQEMGLTMDELWEEVGQEYANEYFASRDARNV